MRRFLACVFLLTSCAAAGDVQDDGIVVSPAERRAPVKKMLNMQEQIDELEALIRKQKEQFDVAHNCS